MWEWLWPWKGASHIHLFSASKSEANQSFPFCPSPEPQGEDLHRPEGRCENHLSVPSFLSLTSVTAFLGSHVVRKHTLQLVGMYSTKQSVFIKYPLLAIKKDTDNIIDLYSSHLTKSLPSPFRSVGFCRWDDRSNQWRMPEILSFYIDMWLSWNG